MNTAWEKRGPQVDIIPRRGVEERESSGFPAGLSAYLLQVNSDSSHPTKHSLSDPLSVVAGLLPVNIARFADSRSVIDMASSLVAFASAATQPGCCSAQRSGAQVPAWATAAPTAT